MRNKNSACTLKYNIRSYKLIIIITIAEKQLVLVHTLISTFYVQSNL